MAAIFVIEARGTSYSEVYKNLQIIDSYMNTKQNILNLVSNVANNPRIYYAENHVTTKSVHDIIYDLRMDKSINHSIKAIHYHTSLMKV